MELEVLQDDVELLHQDNLEELLFPFLLLLGEILVVEEVVEVLVIEVEAAVGEAVEVLFPERESRRSQVFLI
jgi:hypothetical protein